MMTATAAPRPYCWAGERLDVLPDAEGDDVEQLGIALRSGTRPG